MRGAGVIAFFAGALALACGSAGDPSPDAGGADAASIDGGSADGSPVDVGPAVELGVGQDVFELLMDGQIVDMVSGPQLGGRFGGHHIFSAVRTRDLLREELARIELVITSTAGREHARLERDPARAPIQGDGERELWLVGLTPRLDDCCAVANREIVMRVVVETAGRGSYEDSARVRASSCPARGPSLCPP